MPVIAEVTVVPLGTGSPSLSRYVADCHQLLREAEGIRYQLTPMSTVIEGELDRVVEVVRKMHEAPFTAGALRVSTTIRIDDRRDKPLSMEGKVRAVEERFM
ncbi:conserved hypothetical protein [Heliomicrobium modesticaldum Ice1]|uniref:Thiamine-binding protein domain-containing protein n=1 Tax=Heliobacterium modesticaldum (strain ATCC 51547 / Ice1) TaxID=498761 RepID=B0TFM4_HELMI|nr:MTH1187 family thiamine-binding protein [Heliomicrobium modesticaldum]ABZ83123.1 conserved hypothetical protein [Heliomicrobium modesticaldum Ice1]